MGRELGAGFRMEEAYVYLWLIHVDVWQKTSQYCNYLPIKMNKKKCCSVFILFLIKGESGLLKLHRKLLVPLVLEMFCNENLFLLFKEFGHNPLDRASLVGQW